MSRLQLGTIEEEAALCRAAWATSKGGELAVHCHHEIELESLIGPAEDRIVYILRCKAEDERALRLRLFRPANTELFTSEMRKAYADRQKADADYMAKADADYADWQKAFAYWQKADDAWQKAAADSGIAHDRLCSQPDCPWNGHTIFPYPDRR